MKGLFEGLAADRNRSLFLAGFRDTLPVHLGIVPLAFIVGLTAVELGFTPLEITAMSVIVFAGAAQLAAVFLMAEGGHILIVVLTVVLINTRFMMYSASLAPYFKPLSRLRKAVYAFLITDPTYALAIPRFQSGDDGAHWYYFGSGVAMWSFWVLGTALGAGLGVGIPDVFPVELVLPLVFIALLFPVVEDRPAAATAIAAGGAAVIAAPLSYNLGLLVGVGNGLLVGVSLNR